MKLLRGLNYVFTTQIFLMLTPYSNLMISNTNRYARQRDLVDQNLLKKSRVLIAGVGGLGGHIAQELAMAGVGTLILVDKDRVDETNLNRQVLYTSDDIAKWKVDVAAEKLRKINPEVQIVSVRGELDSVTLPEFDIAVDGLDNIDSRFKLEKICRDRDVPYIFGAVEGFMGMVSFLDNTTISLEKIIKRRLQLTEVQVLSATVAVVAGMEALEAIKYICKKGILLKNRLMIYDGYSGKFMEVRL